MIYYNLYDCCGLTIGKNAGIIFDFERNIFVQLSLKSCEIIKKKG